MNNKILLAIKSASGGYEDRALLGYATMGQGSSPGGSRTMFSRFASVTAAYKLKWELVDMGSLNGTLLNSHVIRHPEMAQRNWSEPFELTNGDVITLGTTSKVQITWHDRRSIRFGVGMASDAMSLRRGGKKLPMEDVCYYQWPFPEIDQFGLFGIFDGHGGVAAAKSASKTLPKMVADMLSVSERRERVVSLSDASEILRDAFFQAETTMNHQYEVSSHIIAFFALRFLT
ncbi:hypothetical protein ACLOJK_026014 [Asimina triloba]